MWVLTSAEFDFVGRVPANVRYVGPVLDDPSWAATPGLPQGDDPLVLVGLSSTFQDHAGDAAAHRRRPVDTAGARHRDDRSGARSRIGHRDRQRRGRAERTAQRGARHAAAVVTHGGHGTVIKALAAGVPMVVLPHGRDQLDNAVRVATPAPGSR